MRAHDDGARSAGSAFALVEEAALLADRVVLLGPRPGRVLAERTVAIARPRRRSDPRVSALRDWVGRAGYELRGRRDAPARPNSGSPASRALVSRSRSRTTVVLWQSHGTLADTMSQFNLTLCTPGDEAVLALLGGATFLETYADIAPSQVIVDFVDDTHNVDAYRSWLSDPAKCAWMARPLPEGSAVAYAAVCLPPRADKPLDALWLERLYVLHRFAGQGLGTQLMSLVEAEAARRGLPAIALDVHVPNTDAIAFYERLGFESVSTQRFWGSYMAHTMYRTLRPTSG